MTNPQQWQEVDHYFAETLLPADDVLDAVLARCAQAGLPEINVAPVQGKFLHLLARMCGARRILEIGTLGGYSAIWLARALPGDGQLVSLELNPDFAALARRNIEAAGQQDKVDVVQGPALDSLKSLVQKQVDPFDFVFIDADKESNPDYLTEVLKLARPGTVIVCDNVVRGGAVVDASNTDPSAIGVRRFLQQLAETPGTDSTAVQTTGVKGWDGFSITIVQQRGPLR